MDKFGIGDMITKLREAKTSLPRDIAYAGQLFFQRNFDEQKWDNVPWAKRKKETKRSDGKSLLVASGKLRQSMQRTIRSFDWHKVVWGTDVPYAEYLNDGVHATVKEHKRSSTVSRKVKGGYTGLTGSGKMKSSSGKLKMKGAEHSVRAHEMNMPARPFMQGGKELEDKLLKVIEKGFDKIML